MSLEDQIASATELFNEFPKYLHNFLIKPGKTGKDNSLDIDDVIANLKKMQKFDILGITEKEIGKNLWNRLINISNIRAAMDRANIKIPIHIYGGLDPTITPLYYFVGAEIFDGISWLRYAYKDGVAIYRNACSFLEHGLDISQDQAMAKNMHDNILYLQKMASHLKNFVNQEAQRFDMFENNAVVYKKAYENLATKIAELKGDL
jgi:predicted RNA-binding protein